MERDIPALLSEPRLTLAEVAERAAMPQDLVEARFRAMGLNVPDDPSVAAFGEEDVEAARRLRRFLDAGVPLDGAREVMHVMAAAMSRTAEPVWRLAGTAGMDTELLPLMAADLEWLLRHQLRDLARHGAVGSDGLADAEEVSVAFADIVGFTRLGQEVPELELSEIAERLDQLATSRIRRPARVVKTIGDAVMVVSPDPVALLDAMLDLVDAAGAADGFPPLRAGIAHGRAVARLGDWFGPTVNLAARVASRARPESVLVTAEVRQALPEAERERFAFSEAGLKRLKGISSPVPTLRVRRAER